VKRRRNKPQRAIHANITKLREARGWTQTEFAARVGVDKTRVWHWENGDTAPSGRIMPVVATTLGVTIDELYREAA
jgi:transcriptional regulator with XRE-family HTH domain